MLLLPIPVRQTAHGNTWTLQEVQTCTTDHDLCLSCINIHCILLSAPSTPMLLSKSRKGVCLTSNPSLLSSLKFKWLFFILIFTTYRQSNLAMENAEFPQPDLAGHFQRKILNIIQQIATLIFTINKRNYFPINQIIGFIGNLHNQHFHYTCQSLPSLPRRTR